MSDQDDAPQDQETWVKMSRLVREATCGRYATAQNPRVPHSSSSNLDQQTHHHRMTLITTAVALLLVVPALAATSTVSSIFGGEKIACAKFRLKYPDQTYYPGSAGYAYETQSGRHFNRIS